MCQLVFLAICDKVHEERDGLMKAVFILQIEFKVK